MAHDDVFNLELPDDESRLGFSSGDDEKQLSPRIERIERPSSPGPLYEEFIEDRTIVADFLRSFQCRAIMPQSSKVVVLDMGISLRSALQALEENGMRFVMSGSTNKKANNMVFVEDLDSAPLWDSETHDFVGIVTVTDLIGVLLAFKAELQPGGSFLDVLKKTTLRQCKSTLQSLKFVDFHILTFSSSSSLTGIWKKQSLPLLFLEPDDHLYDAVYTLSKYKVHRVPVIDRADQNLILYVIHPTRIILFLMKVVRCLFTSNVR